MIDLAFQGHEYTWNNRRAGNSNIQERLDRWIDNGEWQILFPQATVNPHTVSQSNYRPIILNTYLNQYNVPKSLRLENSGRAMKEPERALVPLKKILCLYILYKIMFILRKK